MTPEQKLKWAILAKVAEWDKKPVPVYPCENVDELYDALVEANEHWDGKNEVRCCGVETGLKCQWSRQYESKAVAMKMPDGSWVGWTYWYGGGKHGEPSAIDWMEDAYDVEEKMVVVPTFNVRANRELLELAAKAAGGRVEWLKLIGKVALRADFGEGFEPWNPLTDDGDALRLAVKLKMAVRVFDNISDAKPVGDYATAQEMNGDDPYAAARRAIVRAAAEIGKEMEG